MNSIWNIEESNDYEVHTLLEFQRAVVTYFDQAYKSRGNVNIEDQLWAFEYCPNMSDEDRKQEVYKIVELKKVHSILKTYSKDKCPGLDRWIVELFLHFFDLMGQDLVQMVEQSRLIGIIVRLHPRVL